MLLEDIKSPQFKLYLVLAVIYLATVALIFVKKRVKLDVANILTIFVQLAAIYTFNMSFFKAMAGTQTQINDVNKNYYFYMATSVAAFVFSLLPLILSKLNWLHMSKSLIIIYMIYVFFAQILGEYFEYYYKFWWWDSLLHVTSGVALPICSFWFLWEKYYITGRLGDISPYFLLLFALFFSISISVLWEMYEFGSDRLFNTDMQKWKLSALDGLIDTMKDMIVALGGSLISTAGLIVFIERNRKINALSQNPDK